jgi:competence protein ComGC
MLEAEMKKVLLIVLLVVVILVVIAGIFICTQKEKIAKFAIEKSMEVVQAQMVSNLPQTIPADSAKAVLNEFSQKLQSGEISEEEISTIAHDFQTSFQDKELDSTEVKDLFEKIQKLLQEQPQQ